MINVCQWFIRYQRFSNVVLVILALISVVYLPVLRELGMDSSQTLLRIIAPVARSILSRVEGDTVSHLPQGSGSVVSVSTAEV